MDTEASSLVSWHRSMSGFSVDNSSCKKRRLVRRPLAFTEINLSLPGGILNCRGELVWRGFRGVLVISVVRMEKLLDLLGDDEVELALESDDSK